MNRIWHPYWKWEEWQDGMWRNVFGQERQGYLEKAIAFTGDAHLYGEWMLKVLDAWPISCEHNLSDVHINRQAWVGHAACCLAISCPEDITRLAWHNLTNEQQVAANLKADEAIAQWEAKQKESTRRQGEFVLD